MADDVIAPSTGEILVDQGKRFKKNIWSFLIDIHDLEFLLISSSGYVLTTGYTINLTQDQCFSEEEALKRNTFKSLAGR